MMYYTMYDIRIKGSIKLKFCTLEFDAFLMTKVLMYVNKKYFGGLTHEMNQLWLKETIKGGVSEK